MLKIRPKRYYGALQELRMSCKRAQAGKDKAEAHCTELELELETQKAAATALRQVCPFIYPASCFCPLGPVSACHTCPFVPALEICPSYLPFIPALFVPALFIPALCLCPLYLPCVSAIHLLIMPAAAICMLCQSISLALSC